MAKRVDNDSTMELSTSQLVPDQPDHDASVWGQVVVSPDEFAPQAAKASRAAPAAKAALDESLAPPGRGSRAAVWFLLASFVITGIIAALVVIYA